MLNDIKRRFNKNIFKILQNYILKKITDNLGKVELVDDKIICFVNNKNLKKKGKYLQTYDLIFKTKKIFSEEILNIYGVNKPIHYIIENKNFDEPLYMVTPENDGHYIYFKNCSFNKQVYILYAENVVFEDNKYYDEYPVYIIRDTKYFFKGNIKNLTIINDNFVNSRENHPTKFGINITTENLEIINSRFGIIGGPKEMDIKSKNTKLQNSVISCPIIYFNSDNIEMIESSILATDGIIIETRTNNGLNDIQAETLVYNGVDLSKQSITQENFQLQKLRNLLLNKLKSLKEICEGLNQEKLSNINKNLNNRPIVKIIKR